MQDPKYISIAPGLADQKHVVRMGKANSLFVFLVGRQTDADGWVYYRKPINYAWIQELFPGAKRRTLQRWMAQLLEGGYISIIHTGHGFIVQILNQKKWPTRQLPLFPVPDPMLITSGKAGGKAVKSNFRDAPLVAHLLRQKWRTVS